MGLGIRVMRPKCNMGPTLDLGTKEGPFVANWNLQAAFISVSCTTECEFLSFGTCEMQGSDSHGSACLATVSTDFTWSHVALGESRVGGV